MFASSCKKDEGGLNPQMRNVTVRASLAETKVALSGAQLQWENGDELALVFPSQTKPWHVCGLSATIEDEAAPTRAKFRGSLDKSVTVDNGYEATGFAVYPRTAVAGDGSVAFLLPTEQTAAETVDAFAGVQRGLNLTSGNVPLKKIVNKGETDSYFKNACSVLRFTLADGVASMTLTGTSNLTGQAPLVLNNDGRLVIDEDGNWNSGSQSVTIKPYNGESFENGTAYNLLVWPGEHTALTLSVDYVGDYGNVSKTTQLAAVFEPSKYYTLNFDVSSDRLLVELDGALDNMIDGLTEFEGKLEAAETDVETLLAQVQSVALMTEYMDNSVYAPYGNFSAGFRKESVTLDYLIKPSTAAEALVEAFRQDNSVVAGVLGYTKSNGFELTGTNLPIENLALSEVEGIGGIVTATVNMDDVSTEFYQGKYGAAVALHIHSEEAKVDILSDFANLIPQNGTLFSCSYINNVPAIQGASVSIPFSFTLADPSVSPLTVTATGENVESTNATVNKTYMSGNLDIVFSDSYPIEEQTVTLELTVGTEVITKEFTFVDSGADFEIVNPGEIDYVGGDFTIQVNAHGTKGLVLTHGGTGISNTATLFSFEENTGGARTMTIVCEATIPSTSLTYTKTITVTQKAVGSPLTQKYYTDGERIVLNSANAAGCSNYFNIVILGDGFTTRDLNKGGKFEQRARSAMDSFFGIEPYKSFKDRFNVIAVAYKSNQSGTDITDADIERDTYFDSHGQNGSTALSASREKVVNVVKNTLGYSSDNQFFRTIVILLVNTDLNSGSTVYTEADRILKPGFVNGYASFAFACVAANSSGTNGLIKHEAGGHAFGRLADEYVLTSGVTVDEAKKAELDSFHQKGWYWNVTHSTSAGYYNFTNTHNVYPGVDYIEGAWNISYGIYRSSEGGMMLNNAGNFNAISRHAIYHRIITESEGVRAYSWDNFFDYDEINR